jgi:ATP-dependent helicase/nuclease subunit B
LLLDQEREKLSPDLRKASVELRLKLERFARMLAGLRGTITLGFSCHNLPDDRETFPGLLVLSAYRIISNNREADQGDMQRWLAPAASFAPDAPDQCLDETDWWLWRLCGPEPVANAQDVLATRFPHLGQGTVAARARTGSEFTVYDGLLPEPPPELNPCFPEGPVMSASMLETIGRCPLNYFFKYVLEIQPPEDLALDGTRWLDPLEFGNLLHDVFYRFMSELLRQRRLPLVGRDRPVLMKILDEQVDRLARRFPPPNSSVFRQQIIQLTRAADIFLIEEEELCRVSKPVYLEASIGMRPYAQSGELDTQEPEIVKLPGGKSIRARGRIDRVDLIGDDSQSVFAIWDYKSGSPVKYDQDDVFAQGRLIQHALYIRMAAAALRRKVSRNAEVKYFGYFFPGVGARGVRIMRWRDQVAEAGRIVERLCETVARGCFIATENYKEDCKFCDYRPVCMDVEAVADCAKLKLQNPENVNLRPIMELRNCGK